MGPKKGKKGAKKGKKGKGVGDDADPEERNWIVQAEIESLNMRLQRQNVIADQAYGAHIESASRELQNKKIVADEKKRTEDIIADMTR